jgi:hypothetical protein
MDPIRNPFSPGAGAPPPELAGRDELLEQMRVSIERVRLGRPAKSLMLVGLRGVGKTVLLDRIREQAEQSGIITMRIEAPEGRSLPALLVPQLRQALLKLSRLARTRDLAERALKTLVNFARAFKIEMGEASLAFAPEPGLADSGDLEQDLQDLLESAGEAAKQGQTALLLLVDELQYVPQDDLAALIVALHRTNQRQLPVILVGAGLPQLRAQMGKAKSYAERLFDFPPVGALNVDAAKQAILKPLQSEGVRIEPAALTELVRITEGYPYFLQEWGKHAWDVASRDIITSADLDLASESALLALDINFFQVRFDRLTPNEKRYMRAMAELGPGPHRSGDIAARLGRKVSDFASARNQLIEKGMIWSPAHGDTAFTVPLFDGFMKRIMPDVNS